MEHRAQEERVSLQRDESERRRKSQQGGQCSCYREETCETVSFMELLAEGQSMVGLAGAYYGEA